MKKLFKRIIPYISAAAAVVFLVWLYWSNTAIQVTRYTVTSSALPPEFSGYTIVQVSDLHNRRFGEGQSTLIEKIAEQSPDIIVVTGDLIDRNRTNVGAAMEFIEGALRLAPVYYVTGNHEAACEEYEELYDSMENAGVYILENSSAALIKDGEEITISGIADPRFAESSAESERQTVIEELTQLGAKKNGFDILLSHRPEYMELYPEFGYDLVFCGHTHGGQIRLPVIGAVFAPNQGFFPKYSDGYFTVGDMCGIISRGMGNSILPIRLLNRPELVVCTLESE